jgi:iron complex outermembrane recepter protein
MRHSFYRLALLASAAIAAPVLAQPAIITADAAAATAAEDAEIVVYGKGEVRQVSEISNADIRLTVAGGSPFVAIQKLPGVNFQSADPFGVYEWSTRITLRGFNQNQLGFTLDGVPLGDMSYGNTNGLHISRAIIADNIGRTRVSQGAGALGTASVSNLGGTIEFFSRAPQGYRRYRRLQGLYRRRPYRCGKVEGFWQPAFNADQRQGRGRSWRQGQLHRLRQLL